MKYKLDRDVTKKECPWLDRDLKEGEEVFAACQEEKEIEP